jgi:hypothetical protein
MRALRLLLVACIAAGALATSAAADDGQFGVFFDRNASQCSGSVGTGGLTTLYVMLLPSGATYGGIHGAEFRVVATNADGLLFTGATWDAGALPLGDALAGGVTVGFATCKTGSPISILSFQVLSSGVVRDAEIRVTAKQSSSNPNFQCPVAVLCDEAYTSICAGGGKAIVNPASPRPCGASRESSEWTRVKEFYR